MRTWLATRLPALPQGAAGDDVAQGRGFLSFARSGFRVGKHVIPAPRGAGVLASLAFLAAVGTAGWQIGGHHEAMKQSQGGVRDIAARAFGFPIRVVDITGVNELGKDEVLTASGLAPSQSLLFADLAEVRQRLKAMPLVAEATVRKLYPDRINIQIVEREPYALWQLDGVVKVVSADGTVIDGLTDKRYLRLPHVVGPGARLRVKEYQEIINGVPELSAQIRAGILVSERRWTLKLQNGMDVKLPEVDPVGALRQLAKLDRDARVLAKDIIAIDLRAPGRIAFRLTEEAGQARRDHFDKTLPKIKGRA